MFNIWKIRHYHRILHHHKINYSMLVRTLCKGFTSTSGYVTIDTVNEVELFYEQVGDPSQETILCIPGALGTTRTYFSRQLDGLSKTFNVVSFDPRGYGNFRNTERQFSSNYFHQDADDASALMKELGYTKYSVLGWSNGGTVGMILAAQDRAVQNLIIWGAIAHVTKEDEELMNATRDVKKWGAQTRIPLEEMYGVEGLHTLWNRFCDGYIAFRQNKHQSICLEELKMITCPTLIVHGTKDVIIAPCHPEFLHQNIRGSELIVMHGAHHNLHMHRVHHVTFNKYVQNFILGNLLAKL